MSYCSARKQCVEYKGIKSDLLSTKDGVAQGSIVGPILNIIYVNGIIESTKTLKFVMYACSASLQILLYIS